MAIYEVQLEETLRYVLTVTAESREEAGEIAEETWRDSSDPETEFGYEVVASIEATAIDVVTFGAEPIPALTLENEDEVWERIKRQGEWESQ